MKTWRGVSLVLLATAGVLFAAVSFHGAHVALRGLFVLGEDFTFPASYAIMTARLALASLSLAAMGPGLYLSWYALRAWGRTQEQEQDDGASA